MASKDLASRALCVRANTAHRRLLLGISQARASLLDQIEFSLKGFGCPLTVLVALLFLGAAGNVVRADQITNMYGTGTPVMSWAYYSLLNVGKSGGYYPLQADYSNAVFQGFVTTPANGIWGPIYDNADQDGVFVFRTNVLSSVNQTIPLTFGGDDNASAYVNGVFQDYSQIFTRPGHLNLSFTAGVPVLLEIAIYNGPDGWDLALTRANGDNLLGGTTFCDTLASACNDGTITINAVPEPIGIFLTAVGLAGLAAGAYRKRLVDKRVSIAA